MAYWANTFITTSLLFNKLPLTSDDIGIPIFPIAACLATSLFLEYKIHEKEKEKLLIRISKVISLDPLVLFLEE